MTTGHRKVRERGARVALGPTDKRRGLAARGEHQGENPQVNICTAQGQVQASQSSQDEAWGWVGVRVSGKVRGQRGQGSQALPPMEGHSLWSAVNEQSDWRAEIPWCSHHTQRSAEGLRETGVEPMQRPPKPGCVCPQGCPQEKGHAYRHAYTTGAAALCPWRSDPDHKGEAGASLGTAGPSLDSPWKQGRQVFTVVRLTQ